MSQPVVHTPCGGALVPGAGADAAQVTWARDLPAFGGHYPAYPIVPGVFLIDAVLALAGAEGGHSQPPPSLRSVRFRSPVFPGDPVTIRRTEDAAGGRYDLEHADGQLAARVQLDGAAEPPHVVLPRPDPAVAGAGWDRAHLREVIPHRDPLLLVDEIRSCEPGTRATASLRVPTRSAASPGEPAGLPWALLLEAWAQAGAALTSWLDPVPDVRSGPVLLFGGARDVAFGTRPRPGELLDLVVEVVAEQSGTSVLTGTCTGPSGTVLHVGQLTIARRGQTALPVNPITERTVA